MFSQKFAYDSKTSKYCFFKVSSLIVIISKVKRNSQPLTSPSTNTNNNDDENDLERVIRVTNEETTCSLSDLTPDTHYTLQVRALNRIGAGDWSPPLDFLSGSSVPEAPLPPTLFAKSATCVLATWSEPACNNGAPVTEYRLEFCPVTTTDNAATTAVFSLLYAGPLLRHEVRHNLLAPASKYLFRVQAANVNGASGFSASAELVTPAGVPAAVHSLRAVELGADFAMLAWRQPLANGDPVTTYNIELVSADASSSLFTFYSDKATCEYKLGRLQPETHYRIRVQAANAVGVGPFSSALKLKTKAGVPCAPNLEAISASYNSIKLKWSEPVTGVSDVDYELEMKSEEEEDEEERGEFGAVYRGPLGAFKVTRLRESTVYSFRVRGVNESGRGEWSEVCKMSTTKSPPIISKGRIV